MNMIIKAEEKKYHFIIFTIMILITAFMAAFSLAYDQDKFIDTDNDDLTDYDEKNITHTDWNRLDTDNDGYSDGEEVANGYSPLHKGLKMIEADTDNDGLNDDWEIKLGTNLLVWDTDKDGFNDGDEVYNGYSPIDSEPKKIAKKIEVNIKNFQLQYFFGNTLLDSFSVSTGKPSTPTPKGQFFVLAKVPQKYYTGYPNTKWNLHFTTGKNGLRYYIHGAYWHNLFGQKNVSSGCVNVPYAYMERLYNWANEGTKIIIN
jgi:hypothetical protein